MRWLEVRAWLHRILDAATTDVIAYEQAHSRGGAATHVAHALIGQAEAVAAERAIQITSRHTATIKKHATGKGNADKGTMLSAACEKWTDRTIQSHDEADALWLLDLVTRDLNEHGLGGNSEAASPIG
jgi:Holliday junction resolvasome RuvABC endonuclease subunit